MAYTKQNFKDGQVLNAEHLNNIENGISQLSEEIADYSWNDLKNKPFGDEVVVAVEEQTVEFVEQEGNFGAQLACSAEIALGDTIIVDINGEKTECVIEDPYNMGWLAFGDLATITPFGGMVENGVVMIMSATISGNVTVGITKVDVTQIADKYVPIVSPFVINFYKNDEGVVVCDKIYTEIVAAHQKGICVYAICDNLLDGATHGTVAFISSTSALVNELGELAISFDVLPTSISGADLRYVKIYLTTSETVVVESYRVSCTKEG